MFMVINNKIGLFLHPTLLKATGNCTRHYSAADDLFPYNPKYYLRVEDLFEYSLLQLAADIDLVYPYLNKDRGFSLSRSVLDNIKKLIVSDEYNLSPLEVHNVDNKYDLHDLLMDGLMDYPDVKVQICDNDSKNFSVVTPNNKKDALVLQALSLALLRLSQDCMPKHYYKLEDLVHTLYDSLKQIGKANRIYKIDLDASKSTIPLHVVEEKIQSLVEDSSVNKLIGSFFHLPIIERNGKKGQMSSCGIPAVGEISKVLFHITLLYTLDREFAIRFPGIQFCRFHNEAYIFTKENVLLDEKEVHELLEELFMLGKIESIGPGDKPLPCYSNKLIYLDSDSKVELCDYKDYKEN